MIYRTIFQAAILLCVVVCALPTRADDTVTTAPEIIASGLNFPEGPSLSPDGKFLYAVNVHDGDISRVDLKSGETKKNWVTLPAPGRGNGSTIGPDGALYVADVGRKLIARISLPDGAFSTYVDKNNRGLPFRGPNDLCFDSTGNLFFTDPDGSSKENPVGAVYEVDSVTKAVHLVGNALAYPNGIVLNSESGKVFVNQTNFGDILVYTPIQYFSQLSASSPLYTTKPFAQPGGDLDGMRIDKRGYIYAAVHGGGKILKISPKGDIVKTYLISTGTGITNLCFTKDGKGLYVTETDKNQILKIKL